jgi:hypothetical protein
MPIPASGQPLQTISSCSEAGGALWQSIMRDYGIHDAGGLALLQQVSKASDRVAEYRTTIAEQGAVIRSQGAVRDHPPLAAERDARAAMLRAIRYLNLDVEPLKAIGRPPGSGRH